MDGKEFKAISANIQKAYVSEMSYWKEEQERRYFQGLYDAFRNCKAEHFEKAVKKHIDLSSKTPTVADLREIIREMQRPVTNTTEHETTSCKLCGGVGLISYYRWNHKTGFWCEYLCHCNCQNNGKYRGSSAFLTSGEVDELITNNRFVRLNVPYGMHTVPPEEFEQSLKNLPERKMSERAEEIRREILNRRKQEHVGIASGKA